MVDGYTEDHKIIELSKLGNRHLEMGACSGKLFYEVSSFSTQLQALTLLHGTFRQYYYIMTIRICITYFFNQMLWLLFKGSVYFIQSFWLCGYYSRVVSI